jgi:hypothetical protein
MLSNLYIFPPTGQIHRVLKYPFIDIQIVTVMCLTVFTLDTY